jgi:hypothetical protein
MASGKNEIKRLWKILSDERGNVESSLVLIPLLILFLLGLQLSIAVHARNSTLISAQAEATSKALSGEFDAGDQFIHIDSSGDGQNLDLIVIVRRAKLADLIPGFLGGYSARREVNLHGVAVVENQR